MSLFGNSNPSSTSLFGATTQPTQGSSLFGNLTQTQNTGNTLGGGGGGSLFSNLNNNTSTQNSFNLMGNNQNTQNPQNTSGSLFSGFNTNNNNQGLNNKPLFGGATNSMFGSNTNQGTGIGSSNILGNLGTGIVSSNILGASNNNMGNTFQQNTNTFSGFNMNNNNNQNQQPGSLGFIGNNTFQPQQGGSLFSNLNQNPGTQSSLFGQNNTQPQNTNTNMFGNNNNSFGLGNIQQNFNQLGQTNQGNNNLNLQILNNFQPQKSGNVSALNSCTVNSIAVLKDITNEVRLMQYKQNKQGGGGNINILGMNQPTSFMNNNPQQTQNTGTSLFGGIQNVSTGTSLFSMNNQNKSPLGQGTVLGGGTSGGILGQPMTNNTMGTTPSVFGGLGTSPTQTTSLFNMNNQQPQQTSLFGGQTQQQPINTFNQSPQQTGSLFNQPTQQTGILGNNNTIGLNSFSQPQQNSFGLGANNTFEFNQQQQQQQPMNTFNQSFQQQQPQQFQPNFQQPQIQQYQQYSQPTINPYAFTNHFDNLDLGYQDAYDSSYDDAAYQKYMSEYQKKPYFQRLKETEDSQIYGQNKYDNFEKLRAGKSYMMSMQSFSMNNMHNNKNANKYSQILRDRQGGNNFLRMNKSLPQDTSKFRLGMGNSGLSQKSSLLQSRASNANQLSSQISNLNQSGIIQKQNKVIQVKIKDKKYNIPYETDWTMGKIINKLIELIEKDFGVRIAKQYSNELLFIYGEDNHQKILNIDDQIDIYENIFDDVSNYQLFLRLKSDLQPQNQHQMQRILQSQQEQDEDNFQDLDDQQIFTSPTINQLLQQTPEQLQQVKNFKIYNQFGYVHYTVPINLLGIVDHLQDYVIIEQNGIELYPDRVKPQPGQELNNPCIMQFKDFQRDLLENSMAKYQYSINCDKVVSQVTKFCLSKNLTIIEPIYDPCNEQFDLTVKCMKISDE